jgi:hypothetical protein
MKQFLEEKLMKYMIEYKIRTGGIPLDESFAGSEALITAFSSGSRRTD